MKKATIILLAIITLAACKKNMPVFDTPEEITQGSPSGKPGQPPANASPAFTFTDNYQVNGNRTVPAIFVMDVTGANKTKVYSNYTNQATQYPDFPAWSGNGSQLCFTLNSTDLYTLNISLVNGIPTGSNPTKIGDGVAGGGTYKQGKWRPGANQIASVWKRNGDPDKIHLLPSSGGAASVLYTAAGTDWVVENDIAFRSDGSALAFSERQISTGYVYLKVIDVATGQVIKSIDLSQYSSIREMDWAKSPGSNIVAITTVPLCDNTPVGINGIHQLQTIDVGAATPALSLLRNDVGNITWSPNDTQITIPNALGRGCGNGCCTSSYYGVQILTMATNSYSSPGYTGGNHHDWKR